MLARRNASQREGKGLADRDGVSGWLCVYWCSIERASVREFMLSAEKLWFYGYALAHPKVIACNSVC